MNILIAEDNPVIQMLDSALMQTWGFAFDLASNGIEAMEYVQRNRGKYDLCLMDVEMPIMNGIEATRKIREKSSYLPIVAYTSSPDYKSECLSAGMDEFILKPCCPDQLFETINELTVKPTSINLHGEHILITKVMPMNSDELLELRDLKKKGLTKLKIVGLGYAFVVHKNIQNKISHDLIGENKELSEFIDRSPSEPGRCHLYKANLHVIKDLFLPEELEEEIQRENEVVVKFGTVTYKSITDR
jgi:CheY-like chemotaxis protein